MAIKMYLTCFFLVILGLDSIHGSSIRDNIERLKKIDELRNELIKGKIREWLGEGDDCDEEGKKTLNDEDDDGTGGEDGSEEQLDGGEGSPETGGGVGNSDGGESGENPEEVGEQAQPDKPVKKDTCKGSLKEKFEKYNALVKKFFKSDKN